MFTQEKRKTNKFALSSVLYRLFVLAGAGMMEVCAEMRNTMINFEEELEKYEPSPDVEQVENVVNNNNLTDLTDIVRELIADARASASL